MDDAALDAVLSPLLVDVAEGDGVAWVLAMELLAPRLERWARRVYRYRAWRSLELDDLRAEGWLVLRDLAMAYAARCDRAAPAGGLPWVLRLYRWRLAARAEALDGRGRSSLPEGWDPPEEPEGWDPPEEPEGAPAERDNAAVWWALRAVPARDLPVVLLVALGVGPARAARELGVSRATVRRRWGAGLAVLRRPDRRRWIEYGRPPGMAAAGAGGD